MAASRDRIVKLWGLPLTGCGDSRAYTFTRWLAVPLFGGIYRCRVTGTENLPPDGPVIVITNHKSNADPVIAGMLLYRPLRFMAKKELFVNGVLRRLITHLGAFPIDRGAGDRAALTVALELLKSDNMLLMFPEGHRQRDDAVHEFMPGVGMMALRSGAPVVPMAVRGTHLMFRDKQPGFPALRARVGPPVDLSDLTGRNSRTYQAAAVRMQAAVADLYAQL